MASGLIHLLPAAGVAGVVGGPGAGKTSLLRALAVEAREVGIPVAALDPEWQIGYPWVARQESPWWGWRRWPRGGLVLIDEIDRLIARSREDRRAILDLLNLARPWGLRVTWAARRLSAVPRDASAVARLLFVGRTWEPLDLKRLEEWGVSAETAARLPGLRPGQFLPIRLGA